MRTIKAIAFLLVVVLSACSIEHHDTQIIKIEIYQDAEKNYKLLEKLLNYDVRYIRHNVPSINEANASGINLGIFKSAVGKMPSYRITYDTDNPAVKSNLQSLKNEFERFIPKLAQMHASKEKLFEKLSPTGQSWASGLFNKKASVVLENSSDMLQSMMTEEQLSSMIGNLKEHTGSLLTTAYLSGQYYEAFEEIPNSVSLFYHQKYAKSKTATVRVSLAQEREEWKVIGFGVYPDE